MSKLLITWHGHSCFTVSADDYRIVFDPYAPGSVPGLSPLALTADQVLCSHEHHDHGFTGAVSLREPRAADSPFDILKIDTFHDDNGGAKRGPNRIHILQTDGLRIAHMGDLGCIPDSRQMEQLKNLDAVLIPVGGYYTIDADCAWDLVARLSPRIVIPMHYRSDIFGFAEIERLEEYPKRCNNLVTYDTDTIEITKDTKAQTAILKYCG